VLIGLTVRRRVVILIHLTLSAPLWDKAVSRAAIPPWVPYDLFVLYLLYGVTGIANPGRGAFFRAVTAAVDLRSRGCERLHVPLAVLSMPLPLLL
jgi:hypothetical protein